MLKDFSQLLSRFLVRNLSGNKMKFQYPSARRDDTVTDEYHGHKVPDPYRWLEDPDSDETKAFVDLQNKVTFPYLEKCTYRNDIKKRLTELWDYPKYTCPFKRGDRYFYYMNTGLQNQNVLYVQDSLDGDAKVFLDPNKLSEDGSISVTGTAFSENGLLFGYKLSESGSDWGKIRFKNVPSGEDLPDLLEKVKYSSMSWTHDHRGLFYGCYPEQDRSEGTETQCSEYQKLMYHRLGTEQSSDVMCLDFPDKPRWRMGGEVSDCGTYLIVTVSESCKDNQLHFSNLGALGGDGISGRISIQPIVTEFEAEYEYITNEGSICTFRTDKDAPNYRLINIDLKNPDPENWSTLIPENESDVLDWAACVNHDKLVLCYIQDVKSVLKFYDLKTGQYITTFPLDVGTINGFSGEKKQHEIFYIFTSFLTPAITYHCDLTGNAVEPKVFREVKVPGFDPTQFETKQLFYPSKDGTKIPMFVVHKKGLEYNGQNPCLLYGYGGFNISIQPYFSITRVLLLSNLNGVLAVANLRGGGEYGEAWHNGGRFFNKQNVFDDFKCAAKFLVENQYTSASKLIINGGSNGGLLVAACVNQDPQLFGCAVAQVGVMDLLRFHKFTIGHAWVSDYGCADDDEKHFLNLFKLSPVHNVKKLQNKGQYPATLLLTGDHDDRVVPLHSLKYIAELQHVMGKDEDQANPLFIRVDTKSGHGFGKPTMKLIEENSDIYCFMIQSCNLKYIP